MDFLQRARGRLSTPAGGDPDGRSPSGVADACADRYGFATVGSE